MRIKAWAARHAQTFVGSLGRIVQHPTGALLTMAVIAVALALPLTLNMLLQNARLATRGWNQTLEITVYLDKKAAASRAPALATEWRQRKDVAAVRVVTADEALAQFRASSGFGESLDALADNPLPDVLLVTPAADAETPTALAALKAAIGSAADVHTVQMDTEWVSRLQALLAVVDRILSLVAAILASGVLLVVGNTIRLDILNRRAEIEVMKLVGASDGFARRPFLYTGCWYGLGGGIMALVLVALAKGFLSEPVERLASLYASPFRLQGVDLGTGLGVIVCSVGLGWLGSWLAATRHIRRIEPT